MPKTIPEFLHFKPAKGPCMVHDWNESDFREKLVSILRERHGKGGVDICRECIGKIRTLREKLEEERGA